MNGECDYTNGICKCSEGYSGDNCEKKICINNCSGNGKCINGNCLCNNGFIGKACQYSKNYFSFQNL